MLLAVCDDQYKFTIVDYDAYGSESDDGIFAQSDFGNCLHSDNLNIPVENPKLALLDIEMPYYNILLLMRHSHCQNE